MPAGLTNQDEVETIVKLSPAEVGLWRSLGARFHGMEEVVGSIPTRSTRFRTGSIKFPIGIIPIFYGLSGIFA